MRYWTAWFALFNCSLIKLATLKDLETAIHKVEGALVATPLDHPERLTILTSLAELHQRHFERTGNLHQLDISIDMAQEALDIATSDNTDRIMALRSLASSLRRRFRQTGHVEDLTSKLSISLSKRYLLPSIDHPSQAAMLSSLTSSLQWLFERLSKRPDNHDELQAAIRIAEEALAVMLPGGQIKPLL